MNHPTDNIRCGSTVLRYYSAYGGWQLPDKSITRNVLKAYKAAEEAESRKKPIKADWELYEIELVMTRDPRTSARSLAKKLDRSTSDVKNLIKAISER